MIAAMEERYLNTKFNHYDCKIVPPKQRRAAANIYQKCNFFYDRACAASHIVMIICGKGYVPMLDGFHLVVVDVDLGWFSAMIFAG